MPVAGLVVRVAPGTLDAVRPRFSALPGVTVASESPDGFAVVLEAASVFEQCDIHERMLRWPHVQEVLVTYQATEEES